jgi:Domain of unknown function (DUF4265)
MAHEQKSKDYFVEIWFPIKKDEDGYPESKDWEQLLGRPTEIVDQFRLESVPFYLKNVSRGDLVKARTVEVQGGEIFEFDGVAERGGHNTYRLLLRKASSDPESTIQELIRRGLAVEEEHGKLLAVDVPPSVDQHAIDQYLIDESNLGRWEMQDGYLNNINTHDSQSEPDTH